MLELCFCESGDWKFVERVRALYSFIRCKCQRFVLLPCRSVLTVACEQTEVLLFDPISSKHIKTLSEAHEDCVNNIRLVKRRQRCNFSLTEDAFLMRV